MTIAPVIKTVDVKCAPARAFQLFTERMEAWWPATHHVGGTPFSDIVIEPLTGGRWFERGEDGVEAPWGKVLAWAPPGRLLLAWQLRADFSYDPGFETEVEITFEPHAAGTRVRLEHRNLERFGADAQRMAESLGGGWPTIVEKFGAFADQHLEEGV